MGLAPNTIRKYLRSCNPPIKKTLHRTSVLDQFREAIDDYIRKTPKITAKRIHSLLLRDYDFSLTASESTMRKYVGRRR